ncbi:PAS-domain containing protein [Tistrella sp.]|nr:PAS-domain containing protein [Tistrella sp.]
MRQDRPAALARSLTIAALALGALLTVVAAGLAWRSYEAAKTEAGRRATGLALLLAEHAARAMDAVDIEVARIADQIRNENRLPDRQDKHWFDRLRQIADETPQIRALWLIDPAGRIVQVTHDWPAPQLTATDHTYFARAAAGVEGLIIDPPVEGVLTGKWYVPAARAIRTIDNRFLGVVAAAVDPAYFIQVYRSVDVGPGGRLLLLDTDGRKLGSVPDGGDGAGNAASIVASPRNPAGLGRAWSDPTRISADRALVDPDDGVARLYGLADVPGRPLAVAAGLSLVDIRAAWAEARVADLVLIVVVAAVLSVMLLLIRRRIVVPIARLHAAVAELGGGDTIRPVPAVGGAREIVELADGIERMRAALDRHTRDLEGEVAARTAEAADRGRLLDGAFAALGHGIAIFDQDMVLVACNQRYAGLMGVPEDLTQPGTPLARIAEQALYEVAETTRPERIEKRLALARMRETATLTETSAQGRVIRITHNPMADGGSVAIYEDVTEARKIDAALRDSEWRYRLLAENAGDLILRQDPEGTILYASPASQTLLGLEPDRLIGRRLADLVVTEDADVLAAHMTALVEHGRDRATLRMRHATGRPVWVEAGARMIRDPRTGTPAEFHASLRDVGERVAADRAATENSRLLSTTLDSMRQGLCLLDAGFRVVLHNRRFLEMNGLMAEDCPPLADFEQLMHLMARRGEFGTGPAFAEVTRRLSALRRPWPQSWERRRPDGTVLEMASAPFPGGGLVMTFTDVTTRRAAERELARQTEVLRLTIDAMEQGLMLVDRTLDIVVVNRRFQELLEIPSGIARPGNPMTELVRFVARRGEFGPGDPERLAEAWLTRMRDPALLGQPVEHVRPDGRRLELIRLPVDDGGTLTIYTDVTDRRRMQDALEDARERALGAAEARSRFLATVSHEIRNPLNAILNALHFLDETDLDPEQAGLAQIMRRASELLLDLLDDVLDLSRIEAGKLAIDPKPFDPVALARDVKAMYDPQARRKGLEIVVEAAPSVPPRLMGDQRRLRQILVNLTGNAVKFTEAGRVTLCLDLVPATTGGPPVLRMEVIDTGVGIPPEQTRQLFEEYYQAGADQAAAMARGTGLGLAIVRRLTDLLGGRIGCDSVAGEGSRFWFELPAVLPSPRSLANAHSLLAPEPSRIPTRRHPGPETMPRHADTDEVPPRTPIRILLAEDNAMNQMLTARALQRAGYTVDSVSEGNAAVEAATAHDYDLILMDVQMPGLSGLEATRRIRSIEGPRGRTPILALTANAGREAAEICRAAGMDDHLSKPFRRDDLVAAVRRWLPGGAERPDGQDEGATPPDQARGEGA